MTGYFTRYPSAQSTRGGTRTHDQQIKSLSLCQLSYTGTQSLHNLCRLWRLILCGTLFASALYNDHTLSLRQSPFIFYFSLVFQHSISPFSNIQSAPSPLLNELERHPLFADNVHDDNTDIPISAHNLAIFNSFTKLISTIATT